jgi:hypothetical protein
MWSFRLLAIEGESVKQQFQKMDENLLEEVSKKTIRVL